MSKAKDRSVFRIIIEPHAAKNIEDVSIRTGMTQIAITSKLIEWFHSQPSHVQAGVMGFNFDGLDIPNPAVAYLKTLAKT